jgi:predicted transcriptional regulator
LNELAEASGQDQQYHLQRALADYLKSESIREGIEDAAASRLTELDVVKAKWAKRIGSSFS